MTDNNLNVSQWYLVYCKPKQEQRAQLHLQNQGFTTFLPLLTLTKTKAGQKQPVTEPLFARYLFLQYATELSMATISSTRGVVGLVKFGHSIATVPSSLIQQLVQQQTLLQQQDVQQQYKAGDELEVLSGPFAMLKAVFQLADGDNRSMVLLQFLGQAVQLSLDNNILLKR